MWIAYVDESGNSGYKASATFSLGCVLVPSMGWPTAFDGMIGFRRFLRRSFGVPIRDEVKANYLIRGSGTFSKLGLGDGIRHDIYRQHLRLLEKLGLSAFAIVIQKDLIQDQSRDPRDIAWEYLFQRIERLTTKSGSPLLLVHDEGEAALIRTLARKARRANVAGSRFGTGYLRNPARWLVDDPVSRDSRQSYFIQLADLCAYAAYRRHYPPPPQRSTVCPQGMWDELGLARFAPANQLAGGVPGIVLWPT
ncbi:DUF3800 domain-containing protein [Catenulispora subtropica]|uniref:DUF3800 domain-containing protein n=1 Tax=Catenulispora subtropica TaxID=450798 RepID=UPI0031E237A2